MSLDDFEPPEGWTLSTLGQAAQLVKEKVDPLTTPDSRYVGLEHVEAHSMRLLGSGRGSDVKSAKSKFSAGDVLYGKLRPYLNKVAQPDFHGISSTDFLVFTESKQLDAGYLAHYLNQRWVADRAHHLSAGVELPSGPHLKFFYGWLS
jgi:type I restriction enzyme S subunit